MKWYSTLSALSLVGAIICDLLAKRAYSRHALWVAKGLENKVNDCTPGQCLFFVTYSLAITGATCLLVSIVRHENSRYLPRRFIYLLLAVFLIMQFIVV